MLWKRAVSWARREPLTIIEHVWPSIAVLGLFGNLEVCEAQQEEWKFMSEAQSPKDRGHFCRCCICHCNSTRHSLTVISGVQFIRDCTAAEHGVRCRGELRLEQRMVSDGASSPYDTTIVITSASRLSAFRRNVPATAAGVVPGLLGRRGVLWRPKHANKNPGHFRVSVLGRSRRK